MAYSFINLVVRQGIPRKAFSTKAKALAFMQAAAKAEAKKWSKHIDYPINVTAYTDLFILSPPNTGVFPLTRQNTEIVWCVRKMQVSA